MIELLEGVPGSGKSYYAVSERLLKWVRAGRRVYVFVDGFYLDRLALFEGVELSVLQQQITLWKSGEDVKAGLLQVEPGSAVLIDEVQTVFRSKDKTDPALLRWLETHRHRGIDLVLMCQQYGQVTLGVNRLVEATTKFRRLDRFGLKNRYQASVRGNPEELEVIRMFSGKYEPKLYAYYSSYSSATVHETARGGSILKSPTLVVGGLGLVVAIGWFAFGGWLSVAKPVSAASVSKLLPPLLPAFQGSQAVAPVPVAVPSAVRPVRIQGGMTTIRGGEIVWLWVSDEGHLMTEEEIAGESGGTVSSRLVRGVRVLSGTGVRYGGSRSESAFASGMVPSSPAESPATDHTLSTAPGEPPPAAVPGRTDLLATPPGLLASPPGLLATPPDLR
ncbi:MAG: zonular occludens toxin domain-containing protein [Nitrospiraceae bacterium]